MNPSTEHLSVTTFLPPVQALTALWCRTGRGLLLSHEIELDRGIGMSEAAWEKVRAAALEGRVADIPIARETLAAWRFEDVLVDGALEGCADLLPSALVAVETVWGECRHDSVPDEALRAAYEVAAARRERILEDYRPPASDVPSPRHEVHQGCARPDAMSRVRVLHLVDRAISRSPDRWMTARVELARATEYDAERRYKEARESLDAAVRATWSFKRIDRREPAPLALAEHLWRCGEVDDATRLLTQLRGDPAHALSPPNRGQGRGARGARGRRAGAPGAERCRVVERARVRTPLSWPRYRRGARGSRILSQALRRPALVGDPGPGSSMPTPVSVPPWTPPSSGTTSRLTRPQHVRSSRARSLGWGTSDASPPGASPPPRSSSATTDRSSR